MYCSNCGNKIDNNARFCVNCGVILQHKRIKRNKNVGGLVCGIISTITGFLATIMSLNLFSLDISFVGVYTNVADKFNYAIKNVYFSFLFMAVALIFALVSNRKTKINYIGLCLSLVSLFLIITEIVVIIVY